jgi:nucleoside-diphosphate-sugar epimerase
MVFVTGGTGLVGSHLLQELIRQDIPVKALYRESIPGISSQEKVQWAKGDVLDVVALEEALEGVDEVYHCAGMVSYNPKRRREMFKINIEGTANVVNACLLMGVKKLCHVSSVAALGRAKNTDINETLQWSEETNKSNYSKSKHLSEVEVWRGISEGLQAVIVNPSIILGEGDWNKGSTAVFKSAYNEFPWYTEGVTGFVDVKDVVNAMIQLMRSDITQQRFILSEGNHPYKEVFTMMANAFGKKPPHKKVTPLIASLVWRAEALKAMFNDKDPLLTRETANAAQAVNHFDNTKLTKFLQAFQYTPLKETIQRVCSALHHQLPPV